MSEAKPRGFTILTSCTTIDEFIEQFQGCAVGKTLFVNTIDTRVEGTMCGFAILLANRQPVLAGICEVVTIFREPTNPFGHCGMQLEIRRLGEDSERVFAKLVAAKASRPAALPAVQLVVQMPLAAPAQPAPAKPRDKALRTPPRGTPAVVGPTAPTPTRSAVPRAITAEGSSDTARAPSSPIVVPANPLMNLTDDSLGGFIDITLSDRIAIPVAPAAVQESAPTFARPVAKHESAPVRAAAPDHGESGPTFTRTVQSDHGESGPTFVRPAAPSESGPTFVRPAPDSTDESGPTFTRPVADVSSPTLVRSTSTDASAPVILVAEPASVPRPPPVLAEGSAVGPPVRDAAPPVRPVVRHVGPRPITLMVIGAAIAAAVGAALMYL